MARSVCYGLAEETVLGVPAGQRADAGGRGGRSVPRRGCGAEIARADQRAPLVSFGAATPVDHLFSRCKRWVELEGFAQDLFGLAGLSGAEQRGGEIGADQKHRGA